MELKDWISGEHSGVRTIFQMNVLGGLPRDRLGERPDATSNSIAWLVWHLARCEDLAVNSVIRQTDQVMASGDWGARLGVSDARIGTGMTDDEVSGFSEQVNCDALLEYWNAVQRETHQWLKTVRSEVLEEVPDLEARLGKLPPAWSEQGSWVRGMWNGRPNSFFLAWVTIGHGYLHLGEMQSVKTRMGFKGL